MADSNAINVGGAVGPGAQTAAVMARASINQGGTSTNVGRSDGQSQRTMDALFKLGEDILAPHVKAAQTEQFLSGVQRAAAGEGLKEIVEGQPWYTEIFGPSSASMGARAYTTQAAISQFGADMERQMPQLAKGGPEGLMEAAKGSMQALLTGDALADTSIMTAYAEQLGPLMKRHAKENYIYSQKQANAAQVKAWDYGFEAYQVRAAAATDKASGITPEDLKADQTRLLAQLQPFADQSSESFQGNILDAVTGAARKGNFQVINLLEQEGVFKALPPEDQGKLQTMFKTAGRQALDKAMPQFALDVAMLVNDTAQDPRGIAKRVADLNAKAAAAVGVSEQYAQLIPNASLDNIVGNVLRAQAAAANAPNPAAQQAVDLALAQGQLNIPGGVAKGVAIGLIKDKAAEQAALMQWTSNPDPVARAALLNNRGAGGYDAIKADLRTMGIGTADKQDTKGVQQVAATYAALTDEVRGAYFSTDEQQFYDRYNSAVRAGVPPEQAFLSAKIAQPLARDVLPADEKTEVHKAIRAEAENRNENMLGWNTVDDNSLRIIETMIARDYRQHRGLNDTKTSVARSLTTALSNGLEIIGKHATVTNQPGQKSLVSILATGENNMGAKEAASRFETVLAEKVKAVGGSLKDNYVIYRTGDYNGDARFLVEVTTPEGAIKTQTLTGAELRAYKAPASPVLEGGAAFGVRPRGIPRKE